MLMMWKRLVVWLAETLCEVPLLMAFLLVVWAFRGGVSPFQFHVGVALFGVYLFMVYSGYLITTAIAGVLFRRRTRWLYPTLAACLLIVHAQLLFAGWALPPVDLAQIQIGGAGIVFATTFIGGGYLLKWEHKK